MNTVISVGLPLVALVAAGTWSTTNSIEPKATTITRTEKAVAPPPEKTPRMRVSATTLYKNESFDLRFAAPNAPCLGVVDPAGHFFYLVFPAETTVGELKPLVDSKTFSSLGTLTIHTGTLKADPYIYGVYENQRVFTQSGTYTFILGANLHVDDPMLVEKVTIRYVNKPRPVSTTAEVDVMEQTKFNS